MENEYSPEAYAAYYNAYYAAYNHGQDGYATGQDGYAGQTGYADGQTGYASAEGGYAVGQSADGQSPQQTGSDYAAYYYSTVQPATTDYASYYAQHYAAHDPTTIQPTTANSAIAASTSASSAKHDKSDAVVRAAGGEVWEDKTLLEWDPNDFRLFCGDLHRDCTEDQLAAAFKKYPSFERAKVIIDRRTGRAKYGFVGFTNADDFLKAYREMNGKYVAGRPLKLRKSTWKDRVVTQTQAKKLKKEGIDGVHLKKIVKTRTK